VNGTERTLADLVDGFADRGDAPALVQVRDDDELDVVSFADLHERVARAAAGLVHHGIHDGEPVALLADASRAWIEAGLALVRAGAVPVPLDTQFARDELPGMLSGTGVRRVLADRRGAERLTDLDDDVAVARLDEAGDDGSEPDGVTSWREWIDAGEAELPEPRPDDRALLFATSGTTGPPKDVPLAHRHVMFQVETIRTTGALRDDERLLVPLPLHHVYPLVVGTLAPLALGRTVVLPAALTGPALLRALSASDATMIVGVPRLFAALAAGIDERLDAQPPLARGAARALIAACTFARRRLGLDPGRVLLRRLRARVGPRLRTLASGGSALPSALAWRLAGLGWDVASGYGLTETSPLLTFNPPGSRRPSSAGRPVKGVSIRIVPGAQDDEEPDTDAPLESEGEIQARGPGVFDGYHDREEETREAFTDDGWFRTGDLGRFDDGWLYVGGRMGTQLSAPSGEKIRV